MNVIDGLTAEERYAMMRKRHAFLTESVKGYTSLEEYAKDKDEWFAILSVELSAGEGGISLRFQLGYYDYETYYIEPSADGQLVVSPIIEWQDFSCANSDLNIFTEKKYIRRIFNLPLTLLTVRGRSPIYVNAEAVPE